jgi:hypothetical protein
MFALAHSWIEHWNLGPNAKHFLAGSIGAVASLLPRLPLELIKCRQQLAPDKIVPAWEIIRDIKQVDIPVKGFMRAVFCGFWPMLLRDGYSFGVYFSLYFYMKNRFTQPNESKVTELLKQLVMGTVAGCSSWISSYPFDVVRNIIQSEPAQPRAQMRKAFKGLYLKYGLPGLFRGISVTLFYSIFESGLMLLVYDQLMTALGVNFDH